MSFLRWRGRNKESFNVDEEIGVTNKRKIYHNRSYYKTLFCTTSILAFMAIILLNVDKITTIKVIKFEKKNPLSLNSVKSGINSDSKDESKRRYNNNMEKTTNIILEKKLTWFERKVVDNHTTTTMHYIRKPDNVTSFNNKSKNNNDKTLYINNIRTMRKKRDEFKNNEELLLPNNTSTNNKNKTVATAVSSKISIVIKNIENGTKNQLQQQPLAGASNDKISLLYGARFMNGTLGYIADTTFVRKNWCAMYNDTNTNKNIDQRRSFVPMTNKEQNIICNTAPGMSTEMSDGYKILSKVQVHRDDDDDILLPASPSSSLLSSSQQKNPSIRILCAVYTISTNHEKVRSIIDTWGHKCDGFIAFSNETNKILGSVDLIHLGPEIYFNMWQKVRSIWAYIHEHYMDTFDFFHLCGDDTFLIVENLRYFLSKIVENKGSNINSKDEVGMGGASSYPYPLYLGEWFPIQSEGLKLTNVPLGSAFCGGGSGYTLNKIALQKLMTILPTCLQNEIMPNEDTFIGYCLLQSGNITPNSTYDNKGEQMYHGRHAQYVYEGYNNPENNRWHKIVIDFYNQKNPNVTTNTSLLKRGLDAASVNSIAFHRMWDGYSMKRHHAIIYKSTCPSNSTLGKALVPLRSKITTNY